MSASEKILLGIDWGTSNRRAYVLGYDGQLLREHGDHEGILNAAGDFEGSLQNLLDALEIDSADIVMSGMIGSRNGWREAAYLPIERPLSQLAQSMTEIQTAIPNVQVRVVPGYQYVDQHGLPDVMRGEETQLLGALALSASEGWFLLPGTHSKWARVAGGKIAEFSTFMTGELYALMSEHGTLSKVMGNKDAVPEAFAGGVQAARHGGFTHTAFCCRAMVVTDRMPAAHTASYLSGLLIGTELHEILRKSDSMDAPVQVVGSATLSSRYLSALELLGIQARAWQPDSVYVAALRELFNLPA